MKFATRAATRTELPYRDGTFLELDGKFYTFYRCADGLRFELITTQVWKKADGSEGGIVAKGNARVVTSPRMVGDLKAKLSSSGHDVTDVTCKFDWQFT